MSQNVVNPYRYAVTAFETCTGFNNEYDPSTGDGNLRATKITATASGDVAYLSCNLELSTGNVIMALYADDGGSGYTSVPDALMGQTASTACVSGINKIALSSPVSIVNGVIYWIAFQNSASNNIKLTFGQTSGTTVYTSNTYGVIPDPFSSPNAHTTGFQLCMSS